MESGAYFQVCAFARNGVLLVRGSNQSHFWVHLFVIRKNLLTTRTHTKQAIGAVFPVGPGGEGVMNFANHHLTTIAFEETGSYQNNSYLYKITRALIS
jgi:hypothetical protein